MERLVTIVMPIYNAEAFLKEAVNSVLLQSYCNWELLMVDDASTDRSLELAKEFARQDPRIKVLWNEKNQGVANTRNRGIAEAKGDYIALLDSDDVWLPKKLERQVALLEERCAQLAYCSYDFIDDKGNSILKPYLVPETTNFEKMLYNNVIGCSTVLIQADLFKKHRFLKECYHEDYALWMEMLQEGCRAVGLSEVYVHYRKVFGSRSDNKKNAARQRWWIFRKKLKLPFWKSVMAFTGYAFYGVIKHYLKK